MPDNKNIPKPKFNQQGPKVNIKERLDAEVNLHMAVLRQLHAQELLHIQDPAVQEEQPAPHINRFRIDDFIQPFPINDNILEENQQPEEDPFANVKINPIVHIEWGGADVDPSFYGIERSNYCGRSYIKNDKLSIARIKKAHEKGIPVIGICRGAQIANVVNGGILVQHIDGHTKNHDITLYDLNGNIDKENIYVTSTHHQMMIAHKDGVVLGKDNRSTTGVHWENVNDPHFYKYVTEVVYYPKTKTLCIQPHPEWMRQDSPFINWINQFIQEHMGLAPINFNLAEQEYIL